MFATQNAPTEVYSGTFKRSLQIVNQLHTFDEFTTLRSIIVGTPEGANHPEIDISFSNFFQPPECPELRARAVGPIPVSVIDEINEDIAAFESLLTEHGVEVIRPSTYDSTATIKTPFWETSQLYSLMPRDTLLVIGDLIIEVPSPMRARLLETWAFRDIVDAYTRKGGHVIAAPRPILDNRSFDVQRPHLISEEEILFDAANCVRLGTDIFMDINRTANIRGLKWLERTLKAFIEPSVKVHPMSLGSDHVDVTLIPLRPGACLIDPTKVNVNNVPEFFKHWDLIAVEEVMPTRDHGLPYPLASNDGIGRNVLVLGPNKVIVDDIQTPLIKALEKRKFEVFPLQYRHGRTLGGSWHCITLDTNRDGELVSYL